MLLPDFLTPKTPSMKKILSLLVALLFLASCGSGKVREARITFKGDWLLTSITYPGSTGNFNVQLFDDTSAACLESSQWNFISNNNTGSYVPVKSQCNSNTRFFIWSINEVDKETGNYDFMLKPTNEEHESTRGNEGYRIDLVTLTGDQMVWEHTIQFEGEPFTIRMDFTKE